MKKKRERKRCSKQYRDSAERTDPVQPASYRTVIHPTPCKSTPSNSHSSLLKLGHFSPLLTTPHNRSHPALSPIHTSFTPNPHSLPLAPLPPTVSYPTLSHLSRNEGRSIIPSGFCDPSPLLQALTVVVDLSLLHCI
jgi:hypothetical protein